MLPRETTDSTSATALSERAGSSNPRAPCESAVCVQIRDGFRCITNTGPPVAAGKRARSDRAYNSGEEATEHPSSDDAGDRCQRPPSRSRQCEKELQKEMDRTRRSPNAELSALPAVIKQSDSNIRRLCSRSATAVSSVCELHRQILFGGSTIRSEAVQPGCGTNPGSNFLVHRVNIQTKKTVTSVRVCYGIAEGTPQRPNVRERVQSAC